MSKHYLITLALAFILSACGGAGDGTAGLDSTLKVSNALMHGERNCNKNNSNCLEIGRRDKQITVGGEHSCAIKSDGGVACWGGNLYGQLGDGTNVDRTIPVSVIGLSEVVSLSAGENHTCALKIDGKVMCWGWNFYGQLGNGHTQDSNEMINQNVDQSAPGVVAGLNDVVSISSGTIHTCALKADGTILCWGYNGNGQFGDGTLIDKSRPTAVKGMTNIVALTTGALHTCALKSDGAVACWGSDDFGQLGDGGEYTGYNTDPVPNPVAVLGLTNVIQISGGLTSTCAIEADRTISCWGNGTTSPSDVLGLSNIVDIGGGGFALDAGGLVYVEGNFFMNNVSNVGSGNPMGPTHWCVIKKDGVAACWGYNTKGQLGNGTTATTEVYYSEPIDVLGGAMFWH